MHIAYSAFQQQECLDRQNDNIKPNHELFIRYQAYIETCTKFHEEIAAIQKYLPGWVPAFR